MMPVIPTLLFAACATAAGPTWTVVEAVSPAAPAGSATLVQAVGIETLGGVFTPLLPVGSALPCSTTEVFSTAADNQASIKVALYRGADARMVGDAVSLGQFEVSGFAPAPRGIPQVAITFEVAHGQVRIAASDRATSAPCLVRKVA